VPLKNRTAFLNEAIDMYLKDNPASRNGLIKVKMKRLEFKAQKPGH